MLCGDTGMSVPTAKWCEINEDLDACEHCELPMKMEDGCIHPDARRCLARKHYGYVAAKPAVSDIAISMMI